jgi:hypothetical protein
VTALHELLVIALMYRSNYSYVPFYHVKDPRHRHMISRSLKPLALESLVSTRLPTFHEG